MSTATVYRPPLRLGQRVRDDDGFLGTILYIGSVASASKQSEVYCGVEWDDETRGKHDGSVVSKATNEIVRHFKCWSSSPTAASFMKPEKLDFGVSFPFVLSRRYVRPDAPLVAPDNKLAGCVAMTKGGRPKQIEFHGEVKLRDRQQVDVIDKVSLRNEGVSHAFALAAKDGEKDSLESLSEYAGHLLEVDLQGNMLSDWNEVYLIIGQLDVLQTLHLSCNRLGNPLPPPKAGMTFENILVLVLNDVGIVGWEAVRAIDALCPKLEELYIANNDLSDVGDVAETTGGKVSGLKALELLDISGCKVKSWHQVKTFSELPSLTTLILNENELDLVEPCGSTDFQTLQSLQISTTSLSSWSSIDALNSFPLLVSLRFGKCPLTALLGASESRSFAIARVSRLSFLNASVVTAKERGEAEKSYLRRIARELSAAVSPADMAQKSAVGAADNFDEVPSAPSSAASAPPPVPLAKEEEERRKEAVLAGHPRFKELVEMHGAALVAMGGGNGGGSMGSDTINVTITSMAVESMMTEPITKRLPSSLTIGRLKQMCKRVFKLDIDLQVLHFKADKASLMTPLDDDDNSLAYFGVCDGADIFMNEIDVKAREREAAKEAEEQHNRIAKQEESGNSLREHQVQQVEAERRAATAAGAK